MLEFDHVSFTYRGAGEPVLKELSAAFPAGSFTAVIGASGSGKTTLFRLINGLEKADSGEIRIHGEPVGKQQGIIGYMPQQDLLFPWRTVEQNVMLPLEVRKIPKAERQKTAGDMLARVGLSACAKQYPHELSGGMRQRVSFARTLAAGRELLLLDEPFSALDSITRIDLQEWLRAQWNALNQTVIFITHDVEEALFLSGRVLVLTGHPVSGLKEYEVPLPKERTREILLRPDILALKEELISMLRSEAVK